MVKYGSSHFSKGGDWVVVELYFYTVISGNIKHTGDFFRLLSIICPFPQPYLHPKFTGRITFNFYPLPQNLLEFKKVKQSSAATVHLISLRYSFPVCSSIMNQLSQILSDGAGLTGTRDSAKSIHPQVDNPAVKPQGFSPYTV